MKKHIPNLITSLNLLSGCMAIVLAFSGQLWVSSVFIGLGLVFDFFDGFAARLLKVKSEIGKELDSFADIVTFGIAPGIIIYQLIAHNVSAPSLYILGFNTIPLFGFLIPAFSAYRLAKFNLDLRQETVFYGLPTPASALFFASIPLINIQGSAILPIDNLSFYLLLTNFYILIAFTILISWLMVSEIKLFSLKFSNFKWVDNKIRFVFLVTSLILLVLFQFIAIPFILTIYVLLSVFSKV